MRRVSKLYLGSYSTYVECIADLEEKRRKTIDDARLMMIYQISCVDQAFQLKAKVVQEESLAEKRELQQSMFMVLEEKRKKLKQDKDDEGDFSIHETRNRRRLLRKKGEPTTTTKRKQDHILFFLQFFFLYIVALFYI